MLKPLVGKVGSCMNEGKKYRVFMLPVISNCEHNQIHEGLINAAL